MAGSPLVNIKYKPIAEFMGLKVYDDGISCFDSTFRTLPKYDESWNALMPVVEKIRMMDRRVTIEADYYISVPTNRAEIFNFRTFPTEPKIVVYSRENSLLEVAYKAVVEFIKCYNLKQKDE